MGVPASSWVLCSAHVVKRVDKQVCSRICDGSDGGGSYGDSRLSHRQDWTDRGVFLSKERVRALRSSRVGWRGLVWVVGGK